ncbi:Origin of replication complex subunit [Arachis hypogaea]|nr:Origin of replication complex subunit [Arachis hypogaea]
MNSEEAAQIPRRTTRSLASSSASTSNNASSAKVNSLEPLTINDLLVGGDPISLDELFSNFPGRSSQILEIVSLLGPLNTPMLPLFVYGGASTGKISIILQLFRHLNRPLVYSSCRTCYNQRILFESILNQLHLHRKSSANGYSNAKRCERPSDFINFLMEALTDAINNLKEKSEKLISGKTMAQGGIGNMIYLIPFTPLTWVMWSLSLIPVYFPDYTDADLRKILLRNQADSKLYSSFLDVALRSFFRVTRQVDELSTAFKPLYEKYCEPLSDKRVFLNGDKDKDMKRKLFSHINPHITSSLNEIFKVSSHPSAEVENSKEANLKVNQKKLERREEIAKLDFHMSTSAKYLLISAFLASRNPATLDASLFDSKGGSDNRKRKRKPS